MKTSVGQMPELWSTLDASELYDVANWGKGYVSINGGGELCVHPTKEPLESINLVKLVENLERRGISMPVLIRFNDILRHRLEEIHSAFQSAIAEHQYQGRYCCVYPIKVNQQRQVVEKIYEFGRPFGFGFEAGSKPELLVVMAMADNDTPIVCNGFKDDEFIELAMSAHKLGRKIIPIIEKYTELDLILKHAQRLGVRPSIGVRVKLASRGSGRWKSSGGIRSKFGLTMSEAIRVVEVLKASGMADCLSLLHFHLGSQITNIRQIKAGVTEAARVYAELVRMGAGLKFLDVGGGLGIDYDGSQTDFESSINYTLQEYANDVVYHVQNICDQAGIGHPTILSESGRAVTAYHSVLIFNVVGVTTLGEDEVPSEIPPDAKQPLHDLHGTLQGLHSRNLLESLHNAQQALDHALSLFGLGYLPLEQRALAENLYWAIARRIRRLVHELDFVPEELQGLDDSLCDNYFCNFSLFQSMPDSWAIRQLFPLMPIHRLDEQPSRRAVLADITCDSDGKVDQFIDRRDVKRTLSLHSFDGEKYYIGVFLVGAYQEILGDLHNLFGDTNAVHVSLDDRNQVTTDTIIAGDTVGDVLKYVQFSPDVIADQLRKLTELGVREKRIDEEEAERLTQFYEGALRGYTYLE